MLLFISLFKQHIKSSFSVVYFVCTISHFEEIRKFEFELRVW